MRAKFCSRAANVVRRTTVATGSDRTRTLTRVYGTPHGCNAAAGRAALRKSSVVQVVSIENSADMRGIPQFRRASASAT